MKFNKATLLKRVEDEIVAIANQAKADYEKQVERYEEAQRQWLDSKKPVLLKEAAEALLKRLKSNQVIEYPDLDRFRTDRYGRNSEALHFQHDKPKKPDACPSKQVQDLEALRDFLKLVNDEEVTTNGLIDSGFRNIAAILRPVLSCS